MKVSDFIQRNVLAEQIGKSRQTISNYIKQMQESGLFSPEAFWHDDNSLYVNQDAFCYFMSHKKEIRKGYLVRRWKAS